jgi:polysaccharide pyruvyl transferase WcaK-like protein
MYSTIAALSSSVPTISIGYSMKARGINKDIFKHLDWLLPVSELNAETLLGKMQKLLSCKEAVREHLDNTIPEIQKKSLLAGDYVAEVLEANIAPLK